MRRACIGTLTSRRPYNIIIVYYYYNVTLCQSSIFNHQSQVFEWSDKCIRFTTNVCVCFLCQSHYVLFSKYFSSFWVTLFIKNTVYIYLWQKPWRLSIQGSSRVVRLTFYNISNTYRYDFLNKCLKWKYYDIQIKI
jgi:hypothetical protein